MFESKNEKMLPTKSIQIKRHEALIQVMLLFGFSMLITALMTYSMDKTPSNVYEGGIATQNIRADQNYEVEDTEATEKLKDQAAASSPQVYDYDVNLPELRSANINTSFTSARNQIVKILEENPTANKLTKEEEERIKQDFFDKIGTTLLDSEFKIIRKTNFSQELESALTTLIAFLQKRPIIHDKAELPTQENLGIVMRVLSENKQLKEEYLTDFSHIINLSDAKDFFSKSDLDYWQKKLSITNIDEATFKNALSLTPSLIKVNFTIDKSETEHRRERAVNGVESIVHKLQKGQNIILRGERYTKRHITILSGIRKAHLQTNIVLKRLGVFLIVLIILFSVYFYAQKHIVHFNPNTNDIVFIGVMLTVFVASLRFGGFIASSLQDTLPFAVSLSAFYYLIPIAAGAMMVRYILNAEIALIFSIVISFLAGMFMENNYIMTAYYFLSSIIASHLIGHVEKRSSVLSRCLILGAGNIVIVAVLTIITTFSTSSALNYFEMLTNCIFAFMSGVFAGLTLLAVSPIMETLFNYTTNIQLLELANMNHPLLREMIVRSPGTYHHSQLVGVLAEAGTHAIEGNALLARVASYYHDIGKMKKPQYYVENQKNHNPHDQLSPSMSALIVEAHVKDGLDMGKEFKLPKVITDFIPEHQGTKIISYFYHKAREQAGEEASKIDEKDYRYKGPKPQTRESGVVMMADTIEAAVRSMQDKSPQKIRALVEKLVNMHFVDGQLSECDLTLRDLYLITEAFIKTLIGGIYHQRIEYPEDQESAKQSNLTIVSKENEESPLYLDSQPEPKKDNISSLFKDKRKKGT
ncbi:MAG: HDIG domain-containing metalloprotein [bacterium]|nr:HDIG domain-containing protein [bacterium]MBU1917030.1 HDIG domain-containing protein [bacterium]